MIGIHGEPGTYSDRWLEVCRQRGIPFRQIDGRANDVVQQCDGLAAVLWHWQHDHAGDMLVARQVIAALEQKGLLVFPNTATCAHFDDKIAQKYLLEAVGAPVPQTWVFVDEAAARAWIGSTSWPKVFKLRTGAGSNNVRLVRSRAEAEALCRRAFTRGVPAAAGYFSDMPTRVRQTRSATEFLRRAARAPASLARRFTLRRRLPRQVGYVYFQEFLPGNAGDTRITVIGNRAFGFQRLNRDADFRASGSGRLVYQPDQIDLRCVEIAFQVAERLTTQSLAFDFVMDAAQRPLVLEVSYGYLASAVHACAGYWDRHLEWHEGHVWPQDAILDDVLAALACHEHAEVRAR